MIKERLDKPILLDGDMEVKFKDCGNVKEIIYMEKRNRYNCLVKLDKDYYMDTRTGEVKEYAHTENRAGSMTEVRRSLGRLRDYINTNVSDVSCCRWITLTYRENMTDTERLYIDFKNFIKRFRYAYGDMEYIVSMEPQGRGAWHAHVISIFKGKAPFIPNDRLAEIWCHGFVTVKRLDDVDNVGAYLTAYLGDMEVNEAIEAGTIGTSNIEVKEVNYIDDDGQAQKKRYIKGARLALYPPGFNLYRMSRGIKKPTETYMTAKRAKEKVRAATLTFTSSVQITDHESGYQNIIQREYYNTRKNR